MSHSAFGMEYTLSYSLNNNNRNFPKATVIGALAVATCYLLVIVSFYSVLSYSEILATKAVALVSEYCCLL